MSGVRVFADEYDTTVLPPTLRWGKPCIHGHGADDPRGCLRQASSGTCAACITLSKTRSAGTPPPDVDPDRMIERARQRQAQAEAPTTRSLHAPKPQSARGKNYVPPGARATDVDCACGCGRKLTRIAVQEGDPFATKACAGLEIAPGGDAVEDVSDDALAEVLAAGS